LDGRCLSAPMGQIQGHHPTWTQARRRVPAPGHCARCLAGRTARATRAGIGALKEGMTRPAPVRARSVAPKPLSSAPSRPCAVLSRCAVTPTGLGSIPAGPGRAKGCAQGSDPSASVCRGVVEVPRSGRRRVPTAALPLLCPLPPPYAFSVAVTENVDDGSSNTPWTRYAGPAPVPVTRPGSPGGVPARPRSRGPNLPQSVRGPVGGSSAQWWTCAPQWVSASSSRRSTRSMRRFSSSTSDLLA